MNRLSRPSATARRIVTVVSLLGALALPFALFEPDRAEAATPGTDGTPTIAAGTIVNRYGVLSADASAGATSITITQDAGRLAAEQLPASALAAGDVVLIVQMQGATIDTTNGASYGSVTSLNNAGFYEFLPVKTASGTTPVTITIDTADLPGGLRNSYTATGKVQVIRVPQYASVTVSAGNSITAPLWNGATGGVVAFAVQNTATFNATGSVNASGLGFRGGVVRTASDGCDPPDASTTSTTRLTGFVYPANQFSVSKFPTTATTGGDGAEKGESIAGFETTLSGGANGRGAPANGGGGGNSHNGGGGGGANGNNGNTYSGHGVMDSTVTGGAAAWPLDPAVVGGVLTNSSGGGRGGYTYSANQVDPTTTGPGAGSWGGDNRNELGGRGGRPLTNSTSSRLFLGGGGGAGNENNTRGGGGGAGGGLVIVFAGSIAGSGTIVANGNAGANTTGAGNDAPGGGGGGGTVVLYANPSGTIASTLTISANGGLGGNQTITGNEAEGPGGGGGGGFVAVSGGTPTISVLGSLGGTSNSTGIVSGGHSFPSNGATKGAAGNSVSTIAVPGFPFDESPTAVNDTVTGTAASPGTAITTSVLANDTGIDYATVTVAVTTAPAHGTAVVNGSNQVVYTPNAGYAGPDSYVYKVTDVHGLSSSATVNVTIDPAAANKLAFAQQPTTTVAGASITPAVTVQVQDQFGNLCTTDTSNVTVAIGTNPGGGTLSGTKTVAAVGGVATFSNLSIDKTGTGYTLTASDGALTGATSSGFNVTAGSADKLAFAQQPTTTVAGASITPAVTVQVQDQFGNLVTTDTSNVTVAIGTNPGGGTLSGTKTVAAVGGVATFSNLSIDKTGTGYTLTASDGALAGGTSSGFNVTAAGANTLAVTGLPGTQVAGALATVTVTAKDQFGNVATGYTGQVTFSSTDAGGSTLLPANYTFVAGDNGAHTFTNGVKLTTVGTQTVTATDTVTNTIKGTSSNDVVTVGSLSKLAVSGLPGTQVAGAPQNLTVQAQDQFGNTITGYTGTVHFTSTDAGGSTLLPADYTFVAGDNGAHTFTNGVTLTTVGTQTVTAKDTVATTVTGTSGNDVVTAGAAKTLAVTGLPGTQTAGVQATVTVTAQDQYGNVATGYLGTVHFTSTDAGVSTLLPANYTFVAGDSGAHTFPNGVTLTTVGTQTVTATDTVTNTIKGTSSNDVVTAAAAKTLAVAGLPGTQAAGTPETITVTAKDPFGNVATGYVGTVQFTSSDVGGSTILPTSYTFVAGDNGAHTFSNGVTLTTAGTQTVTAKDSVTSTITGTSSNDVVTPGTLNKLAVTGLPGTQIAGTPTTVTVTAQDSFGNTITGYVGTIHFTSTDAGGSTLLPANYTFVGSDNGAHTFTNGVTLTTVGTQTVTAKDTVATTVTGTSGNDVVTAGAAKTLAVTGLPGTQVAGAQATVTVTAKDQFGNVATGYVGTVHFTSTDAGSSTLLPANYTFVAGDSGAHAFASGVTLTTVGTQTVTAKDTVTSTITGTSGNDVVTAGAAKALAVTGLPATQTAGTPETITVTAKDLYGNTATGYTGQVTFSSTDVGGSTILPASYTFVAGDSGAHTFTNGVTLTTAGTQAVTAKDTVTSSITGTSGNDLVTPLAAKTLAITGLPATQTAGTPATVVVTAKDQYGNVATGYTGTVHFTSTDTGGSTVLPANYTFVAGDSGAHTFMNGVALSTLGTQTVTTTDTVTATITGTSGNDVVTAAVAKTLVVTGLPSTQTAGTPETIVVTAKDPFGNVATNYVGTVHFTSTDAGGSTSLPADYTFVAGDAGVHTFTNAVTLTTAGTQTVTAKDTVTATVTGTSGNDLVTAGAAKTLAVTGLPGTQTAGVAATSIVTAKDQYGNVATGYLGTVHFTSTDAGGSTLLPADYKFVAGDSGAHTFTNGVTLTTVGTQTVTAKDTVTATITGTSGNDVVTAAAAKTLAVTGLPGTQVAGVQATVTVTARDPFGNVATGYVGTVHFTSTDAGGSTLLPANYTFLAGDNGSRTFTNAVTLTTAGTQTVTAADTVTSTIKGTTSNDVVTAGAARTLSVTGLPATQPAGTPETVTVTAKDLYGNTATGYAGQVHFTSTDAGGSTLLPANYAFVAGDNGAHTFTNGVTLTTAGTQTVTAKDTVTATIAGTSGNDVVTAGATTGYTLTGMPVSQSAGQTQSVVLTAVDTFGNATPGYRGTAHFTSTDPQASLPVNYTFTAGDAGVHTFASGVTLKTVGSRTVTATDTATSSIKASQTTDVGPASIATLVVALPPGATAGAAFTFTVTAKDSLGNTDSAYLGTVHFTSSDATAVLPADYAFTAGDAGVHVFTGGATLDTSGNQTITATDTVTAAVTGTGTTLVGAGAAAKYVLAAPATATTGVPLSVTLTVEDAFGNVVTGYTGTAHFTSSDPLATLPPDTAFTASDKGVHTFGQTDFGTGGSQTLTATDTSSGTLTATKTIVVDAGVFQFSTGVYSVLENAGNATITITRNVAGGPATVDFATADNTAVAGTDYTTTTATVSFVAGQTSATLQVPVLDDGVAHAPLTVKLTLAKPTAGTTLGPQSFATLAIADEVPFSIPAATFPHGVVGSPYSQTVSIPDGGVGPTFHWTVIAGSLPPGLALSGDGRVVAISGSPTTTGTFTFTLEASDDGTANNTATQTFSITVDATATQPPAIVNASLPSGRVGGAYGVDLTATQGTPGYTWSLSAGSLPAGLSLDAYTGRIAGTPTATGTTSFTVQVTDSAGKTATKDLSITIGPAPIAITTLSLPDGAANVPYAQPVGSTGGLGPTYTWTLGAGTLPTGLAISGTGPTMGLSGTPTAAGPFDFTLQVSDDGQTGVVATQRYLVTIASPSSPAISTIVLGPATDGTSFSQTLTEAGGTGPFTWAITGGGLPPGLSLDPTTGIVSGTPTLDGTFTVTIRVTDKNGKTSTKTFQVVVAPPPSIVTTAFPDGIQNNGYSAPLEGTGGVGPYVWTLPAGTVAGGQLTGGGLPAGLSLSTSTGLISGVPTVTGTFPLVVTLTDANGTVKTRSLDLIVGSPPTGPTVLTTSLPRGAVGTAYSTALVAAGGKLPYASWTVASGSLPAWASLDSKSGTISGTPTVAGTTPLTFKVTDAASAQATSVILDLVVLAPIKLTTSSLPLGAPNVSYTTTLAATGGTGPDTWSIVTGKLPPGFALDAKTGVISGTTSQTGSYPLLVEVTDANGQTDLRELVLTIASPQPSPSPSPAPSPSPTPAPQPPTIVTTALPGSPQGGSYSSPLVEAGGQGPFTWTISGGTLPPGLSLGATGVVSGNPTTPGTYTFTVQVRDANGLTASQAYTVAISAVSAPPPQLTGSGPVHVQGGGTAGSGCVVGGGSSRESLWPLALVFLVLGRARRARSARSGPARRSRPARRSPPARRSKEVL